MTQAELNQLERDVEEVRQRVAHDLERLRSPATISSAKQYIMTEAREKRDDLVARTKDAASDGIRRLWAETKERAAANPAAALAIGAGLAWRAARHPPISSILIGVGLVSLMRTDPRHPATGAALVSRAGDFAETALERASEFAETAEEIAAEARERTGEFAATARRKVEEWRVGSRDALAKAGAMAASATEVAGDIGVFAKDAAGDIALSAKGAASEWGARAAEQASQVAGAAKAMGSHGSEAIVHAWRDEDERDTLLLGAAAVALTAALGIAFQRRATS